MFIQKLYLQQIIENLLSNAIKYSNSSVTNASPQVSVSLQQHAKQFTLIIDDNGIPEKCREKVFVMFMRFRPKVTNGSGLELYLTKQNAMAIGGNLAYEPLAPGSRFIVTLQSAKG